MPHNKGSAGIYFVVHLPKRWELMVFRFDEHPDGGHPEYWEAYVSPVLARAWTLHSDAKSESAASRNRERRLKAEIDIHYDAFPRGRVTWIEDVRRFAVFHGANLKPTMKVSRAAIEKAFSITGRANWEFDEHEQCSPFSAEALWSLLPIRERWKTAGLDFS